MKISLRIKFIVPVLVVALTLGVVLGFIVPSGAKKNIIERVETITSNVMRWQVEKILEERDFFDPIQGFRMQNVPSQLERLRLNREITERVLTEVGTEKILRIKLWDTSSTVIYSDLPQVIGLSFPESVHLQKALAGEINTEISRPDEPENIYDKGLRLEQVLEVYTPIISKQTGEVIGVVETYHSVVKMMSDIKRVQFVIWLTVSIPIFVLLIFILALLDFSIIRPLRVLGQMTKIVGQGKFKKFVQIKSRDEIGELSENFNLMIKNLKVVTAELGRAKELDRLKVEYVTILAHRFLTPLSRIKWAMNLLMETSPTDKEEQQRLSQETLKSSEDLIKLTGYFLRVAEMEEGLFGYKFQPVLLEPILEKVIRDHLHRAEEKKILMVFGKYKEKLPPIKGDTQKLEVTFSNLLDNAIKYTPAGGKVIVGLDKKDQWVEVRFTNTGMGISREDAPHIFTKFFRAKVAQKSHTEGTGLGLFVTKNVIKRHGGKITFQSKQGKGTTFIVSFPLPLK